MAGRGRPRKPGNIKSPSHGKAPDPEGVELEPTGNPFVSHKELSLIHI